MTTEYNTKLTDAELFKIMASLTEDTLTPADFTYDCYGDLVISDHGQMVLENQHKAAVLAQLVKNCEDINKQVLEEVFAGSDIRQVDCDRFSLRYKPVSTYKRFDTKKYKADHPEEADKYMVESTRKGSVTVDFND